MHRQRSMSPSDRLKFARTYNQYAHVKTAYEEQNSLKCICEIDNKVPLFCLDCEFAFKGYLHEICPMHPNVTFLCAYKWCPMCKGRLVKNPYDV